MAKKGLGRGLDALLYDNTIEDNRSGITMLKLLDIEPNKTQARKSFDEASLNELASSILLHGLVQPIIVRRKPNGFYEIIAGERRWRACKRAGLTEVPVIVKDVGDLDASEISLIENLQREDLNPVEEANGYKDLIESYGLTQEEVAKRIGKSRAAVANILRILKLPQTVLKMVENNDLSYGHARTLLPLCNMMEDNDIVGYAKTVIAGQLSVRETEHMVKVLLEGNRSEVNENKASIVNQSYYKLLENRISSALGRRVLIKQNKDGKGQLSLSYSDSDDLEALLEKLCGNDFTKNIESD